MCFVRLLLEAHPFVSNKIALLLSWYRMLSLTSNPCALIKRRAQSICGIRSSTATISLSVELRVLSLCFVDLSKGNPLPMVIAPPVCPLISGCTANDASTYQLRTPVLSPPSINGNSRVAQRYSITWRSLHQSSMLGPLTLVVRIAIASDMSGLALLVT